MARSPHNIVHLDLPEGEGDAKYENAAAMLQEWIESGALVRDEQPRFLIYEQTFSPPDGGPRLARRGFFALVRTAPYETRDILPHERTLSGPKVDRFKLFTATRAALSPIFLLYRDPSGEAERALSSGQLVTEFETEDGVTHRLGELTDAVAIQKVTAALANESFLIADGHHRYETTLSYGDEIDAARAKAGEPASPNGAHRYVFAFLADADSEGLVVFPTHRLVHGLDIDKGGLLGMLSSVFDMKPASGDVTEALAQAGGTSFAVVFRDGETHILTLKESERATHPALAKQPDVLRNTDVVVLHEVILEGLLGITKEMQAKKTNIKYFKSTQKALKAITATRKRDVLFVMNATPVAQVLDACLAGEVMPQKSTFFYPKVPTGLAIHVLDPEDEI